MACTWTTATWPSSPISSGWVTRKARAFLVWSLPSAAKRIFMVCLGVGEKEGKGSAQHEHRYVAVGQHVLGLAAQEQPLDALAAVRGHHDEVALVLAGRRQDGF